MNSFLLKTAGAASAFALSLVATPALASSAPTVVTVPASNQAPITLAEVSAAQQAWGDALVRISRTYEQNGREAAVRLAEQVLDSAYGYSMGPVLFKPTLAAMPQNLRPTREGALAYFVGGNSAFPGDTGFALKNWRDVRFDTRNVVLGGNTAMTMGNVSFTDTNGTTTTVDKTFGYVRGTDGRLRIVLHHSSLPYSAN